MLFRKILYLTIIYSVTCPVLLQAQTWEDLFSSKIGQIEAKVELRKRSFKKRLQRGEKIVTAQLRSNYSEAGTLSTAIADYEIYCASRKAYRSNMDFTMKAVDGKQSTIKTPQKTQLEGQDYTDFIGLMEILCARD